jgi:hypothetical protein
MLICAAVCLSIAKMGDACGKHEREEKWIEDLGQKNLKEKKQLGRF